jgi:hypothetical protein
MNTDPRLELRRTLVHRLYTLGISMPRISELLGNVKRPVLLASVATVRNDIAALGGPNAYPNRPQGEKEAFVEALRAYLSFHPSTPSSPRQLKGILWDYLGLSEGFTAGMIMGAAIFERKFCAAPKELENYLKMIEAMFGGNEIHLTYAGEVLTEEYLDYLQSNPADISLCDSANSLARHIIDFSVERRALKGMPIWPTRDAVDSSAESILSPRDWQVLQMYFGLPDGNLMTLEQMTVPLGITKERVRQIRDRAMRRLRGSEFFDLFSGTQLT